MIIKNFLDSPNIFDYSDKKNIKSLNIQINLTHIIQDKININHYYSYLLVIGLIRNQIFLYKKLKKLKIKPDNINLLKIETQNKEYKNINLLSIYKGLKNIYNLSYKQSIKILNNLIKSIYIKNKKNTEIKSIKDIKNIFINVKSPSNFYHEKDIIVPFIIKNNTKLDFKNFRKYLIYMLGSIPLVKEKLNKSEKNKIILKTNLSYEKIATLLELTKSYISNVLKNNKKIYLFEEINETEYNFYKYIKQKVHYVFKIYINKNITKYYKFKGVYNYNKYKWQYYIRVSGKNKKTRKITDRFLNTYNRKGGFHGNYLFNKLFTGSIYTKEHVIDKSILKELDIEINIKYKKLIGINEKNYKEAVITLKKLIFNINNIENNKILEIIFNRYNKHIEYVNDLDKNLNLIKKKKKKSLNIKSLTGLKNAINNKKVQKFLDIKDFIINTYLEKNISKFNQLKKEEKKEILSKFKNNGINKEFQQNVHIDIMFISLLNEVINNFIYIIKKYKKYKINNIKYSYFKYLIFN